MTRVFFFFFFFFLFGHWYPHVLLWAQAQQPASRARSAGVYTRVWSVPKPTPRPRSAHFPSAPRSGPRGPRAGGRSWLRGRPPSQRALWAGPRGGAEGETPRGWGVRLLRPGPAGGRRAPRPPAARAPPPPAGDGLPPVSCRLLGKLVLLLSDSSPQTSGPGRALAAGDGRH